MLSGAADFEAILVYDVSRWGRFQDVDESAHYEFLCRQMGIQLHYCGEMFENDGTTTSAILKSIKRIMAAEYSRELSVKIYAGQARTSERGFRANGGIPYGYQRMLVDAAGREKGILHRGEAKRLQTDRVTLVPGPPYEVALVREMFDLYVNGGLGYKGIANLLNERGVTTRCGGAWRQGTIGKIIANEVYVGTNVFGRKRRLNLGSIVRVPSEQWVRAGLIARQTFEAAQAIRKYRHLLKVQSDEVILRYLGTLLAKHGRITHGIIEADREGASVMTVKKRFGSLRDAYARIGYSRAYGKGKGQLPGKRLRYVMMGRVVEAMRRRGIDVQRPTLSGPLLVGDLLNLRVLSVRRRYHPIRHEAEAAICGAGGACLTLIVAAHAWAGDDSGTTTCLVALSWERQTCRRQSIPNYPCSSGTG